MPERRLRVAVVGPGGWGRQHTRVFSTRPDTQLVAIVGRDPGRTEAAARVLGTAPYTDLDRMLVEQRPELVSVSLPNEQHFEPTLRLLDHDVPLLLEKPLVFEPKEADLLVERARAGGRFVGIDFNHRYAEPMLRAGQAIEAGQLGDLVFAIWRFGGERNPGASPHKNLIETQCHGFDLLEHLLGPIASVAAQMTDKTYGAWSTVALALRFRNGAVGTFLGSYDSSYAYRPAQYLEINGTEGRVCISDTVREFTFQRTGDADLHSWQAAYFDDPSRAFHATFDRCVDDFLRALRAGARPPVPITAGRRALRLAWAAIRAFETGRTVSVDGADGPDS